MKYRLKQDRNIVATYSDDFKEIETEIEKDVRKMSFYRSNKQPVLALGSWPGIALWKIKDNSLLARRKISATKLNRSKTRSAVVAIVTAAIVHQSIKGD